MGTNTSHVLPPPRLVLDGSGVDACGCSRLTLHSSSKTCGVTSNKCARAWRRTEAQRLQLHASNRGERRQSGSLTAWPCAWLASLYDRSLLRMVSSAHDGRSALWQERPQACTHEEQPHQRRRRGHASLSALSLTASNRLIRIRIRWRTFACVHSPLVVVLHLWLTCGWMRLQQSEASALRLASLSVVSRVCPRSFVWTCVIDCDALCRSRVAAGVRGKVEQPRPTEWRSMHSAEAAAELQETPACTSQESADISTEAARRHVHIRSEISTIRREKRDIDCKS